MRVLVTGANGFVGSALCRRLVEAGHSVVGAVRRRGFDSGVEYRVIGDIGGNPSWDEVLAGVDVAIHLAALVHQMGEAPPLAEYRRLNVGGTAQLANACVRHGVSRMVFLSSIKVNGECTPTGPFTEADEPAPLDAYGISKLEAEQALTAIANQGGMQTVVVRPPLVYGPGVRANFLRLLGVVRKLRPLVIPRLKSKRSMIALGNLVDILAVCSEHQAAANQLFLVSDNEDVTVTDLMQRMALAMKRKSMVVPLPVGWLRLAAKVIGKEQEIRRLTDPLTVNPEKAMKLLGWRPPLDLNAGLAQTVDWYRRR